MEKHLFTQKDGDGLPREYWLIFSGSFFSADNFDKTKPLSGVVFVFKIRIPKRRIWMVEIVLNVFEFDIMYTWNSQLNDLYCSY